MSNNKQDINEVYNFLHDGISSVVSVSNDFLALSKDSTIDDVINLLIEKLKNLEYFDSFAFYEIRDLINFNQSHCYPESASKEIEEDVEAHIANGTFAWALNSIRPTVFDGPISGNNQVLVSLATKRRIHGMFVANAKDNGEISGVILDMLQLILSITVFSIDNFKLTERLTDYTRNLEDKVAQRTAELEDALVRVEQSSAARSEFLANMSHEIRTPMNGVLGMLDLLKETPLNKNQLHYVTTAKNSGNNMLVILNDILDLSKVESGKLVIEEEEFNIVNTIADLVLLFSIGLQEKRVELIVSIDPVMPAYLLGGQTRFWQIVMNLLGNANKFTEKGEIFLSLTLNDLTDNEVDILVSVKDTGIGIAENSLGKIFQSFEQAEVNTSRHYGGTGLGLTLCRNLIEMMGGEIKVKSVLGEGSEFYFNVKMKRVFDAPKTYSFVKNNFNVLIMSASAKTFSAIKSVFDYLHIKHEICSSLTSTDNALLRLNEESLNVLFVDEIFLLKQKMNLEKIKQKYKNFNISIVVVCDEANKDKYGNNLALTKPLQIPNTHSCLQVISGEITTANKRNDRKLSANVLIVEDNKVNQMVVSGFLENIGCDFSIANNGKEGLEFMHKDNFDMVFMDINMPVLNGCDATIEYRKTEKSEEHIPIIALTANVLPEDVAIYLDSGMDDYVSKPFSQDILRSIITKWVPQAAVDEQSEDVSNALPCDSDFDEEIIKNLKDMMGDGYEKLVSVFIEQSSELKSRIRDNKDNIEKLIRDIHSLKGSSGTMGAKKLFSLCEKFELALSKGDAFELYDEVRQLSEALDDFHEYLLS